MWRDSLLVAGKDLRIEARSRVGLSQVAPFGVVALVLFAFALGPDRVLMAKGAPGLFWVAVLFCTVLAVQRSVSVTASACPASTRPACSWANRRPWPPS